MNEQKLVEGMPGTWSHCGNTNAHVKHRHRVVMNEGPYDNVLCLGTPGDATLPVPPLVQPIYGTPVELETLQVSGLDPVKAHAAHCAAIAMSGTPGEYHVEGPRASQVVAMARVIEDYLREE